MTRSRIVQCQLLALIVLFLTGCFLVRKQVKSDDLPPPWVDQLPRKPKELCAVGYAGPTMFQQDCVKNSADNARGHLAESISVSIKTITIDITDGTRGSFSKDVVIEGSESASQCVLEGSELQAQWIDEVGQRGQENGCYTLVCIDPSKPLEKFVESVQTKLPPKTVEKVRENAEAAFEELAKAEATRNQPESKPAEPPAAAASGAPGAEKQPEPAAPKAPEAPQPPTPPQP